MMLRKLAAPESTELGALGVPLQCWNSRFSRVSSLQSMWLVIEARLMLTKELQHQQQQIHQQERRANSKGFWLFLGCKEMKAYPVNTFQKSLLQTHSKACLSGDFRSCHFITHDSLRWFLCFGNHSSRCFTYVEESTDDKKTKQYLKQSIKCFN